MAGRPGGPTDEGAEFLLSDPAWRTDEGVSVGAGVAYDLGRLSRYDVALGAEDRRLKREESTCAIDLLRREHLWGRIESFLDVGTCTGRYLLQLAEGVRPGGRIVGLDADPSSVRFARRKVAERDWGSTAVSVVRRDFTDPRADVPGGPFGLVTAMMSTISHFGRHREYRSGGEDPLQRALRRCHDLLEPDGLLMFSVWSGAATAGGSLLEIYDPEERRRLIEWTPARDEVAQRLDAVGLGRHRRVTPHRRLDLWICRR